MHFQKKPANRRAAKANRQVERVLNQLIRGVDGALRTTRLGGRKANYDDVAYHFEGGKGEVMRRKHYDKSLRLLWKAEDQAPWSSFRDSSKLERRLRKAAMEAMTDEEKAAHERISLPEYKEMLNKEYTEREKQAIVAILTAIGHGEAYAWLVAAELLAEVKSTGAKAALTMQVMEEAKHFVVLRELIHAFDVPVPRQSVWEYVLLENVYKSKGLDKLFGMNILVEGVAMSLFGLVSTLPGLEVLHYFHRDEARHMGLPANYLREFPLSWWQRNNPMARARRLKLFGPAVALIPFLEEDLAELGVDAFDFAGSVLRKLTLVAERNGFVLPIPRTFLMHTLDRVFNLYCHATREGHEFRAFSAVETTIGERELQAEGEIWAALA
ncbi:MAG: hypothetical protein VYE15_03060 [Myxococcota bacterium]|nr:hypothetical protein [Myxococcota bacterium]